ncbi:MAG: hypothetical protein M0P01_11460 [Treponema sp.]|nr:hypothetical protein [Treponema sp.]
MPGLSQLKQFNSDILALGREAELRAARGEKTIVPPVPKSVENTDDSEDFVLGMPETEEDNLSSGEQSVSDDDFSDITGEKKPADDFLSPAGTADVPDVSALLNPLDHAGNENENVPDLSQFMEPPQESEPEPEPPSIADLGLDDLLNSTGFDSSSEKEPLEKAVPEDDEKIADAEPYDSGNSETSFSVPDDSNAVSHEPEVPAEQATFEEPVVPSAEDLTAETLEPEEETTLPKNRSFDDGFDYAGETIDMNAGVPGEISGSDTGVSASVHDELEPAPAVEPEKTAEPAAVNFSPESSADQPSEKTEQTGTEPDFTADDFNLPDFDEGTTEPETSGDLNLPDIGAEEFNPDTFDFSLDDTDNKQTVSGDTPGNGDSAPSEKFDTSDMDGLDFSIKETDANLTDGEKTDFELGNGNEFQNENSDFEIPGFSDTDTAKQNRAGKIKLSEPDFTGAAEGSRPEKNTLTDGQYKQFLSNLSDYPLNVRVAVENLLVKNEFTDEAQFEVIQKILDRVPARQIAAHLEKMLDISIPVPRDYERRTAAEYDAFKTSLQYQLRNKIIPGVVVGIVFLLLSFGLFEFVKNLIYKPLKANSLYKQGYTLLQADEYPLSEMKFDDAAKYQLQKNWFYKYARGYRSHKQYQRAEKMFRNILYCFNHDKNAGIEYAQMECTDLANYEKAEEVAKREVLDYHINDPDGILLLGDVYLEWGTEKDPAKLEDARRQYATLVQLYGQTDLYMSRMMRYFIRTDNLREVLELKEHFYPRKKSLGAADWTELSGYMLDKLYGQLAPSDEYLRAHIEDVKDMLVRAVESDPANPVALYNLSRYFVHMNNTDTAVQMLGRTLDAFKEFKVRRRSDTYKEIDSYRLLGEEYTKQKEYLKAQESYTGGITVFAGEQNNSGFEGNSQTGRLFADAGDIDYFIHGNLDSAYDEYTTAVNTKYDTSSLHYRIGYIDYVRQNYDRAVGSFIKAGENEPEDNHLLLAMGDTLSLRGDDYAAQGYYERLIHNLDIEKEQKGILFPQVRPDQAEIVDLYMKASNNLGVTLYRLARRSGSSQFKADAMVQLSTSMRAWDALTRNQVTMIRLSGSNLAEQNMKYMSHPVPDYEPAIYTDIPRIMSGEEELSQ